MARSTEVTKNPWFKSRLIGNSAGTRLDFILRTPHHEPDLQFQKSSAITVASCKGNGGGLVSLSVVERDPPF
ncbi:MAG: hypothetical protein NTW75_09795 [Planctomycetales bacterium]|nr:hypothetical protein [Planctomycetales bacterium]